MVGTRTAVFAPMPQLGLIVIDEAHDGGYKSDRTPRFDARWVARRRAALTGARLVLGTATPDVVTSRGRAAASSSARCSASGASGRRPTIELVDLRDELSGGNRSIFSRALQAALAELRAGTEQAVLLDEPARRIVLRPVPRLRREPALPGLRPAIRLPLGGRAAALPPLRPLGAAAGALPALRQRADPLLRGGHPAGRGGAAHSISRSCASRGWTRMRWRRGAASNRSTTTSATGGSTSWWARSWRPRGSTCRSVTLAAVIAADVTLNLPDYLAAERTFQLLAQVAGRAGRGPMPGRVIIQTYAADHYAVRAAARLDVDGFADEELVRRRLLGYPPATVLARLLVADPDRARGRGTRPRGRRGGAPTGRRGPRPAAGVRAAARRPLALPGRPARRRPRKRGPRQSSASRPAWRLTSTPNRSSDHR